MGLLKNMVGNAISDGLRKGIGEAVGKAVEKAVTPAAERWADKGAQAIDSATAQMDKGIQETNAALSEAGAATAEAAGATRQAVNAAGGFAGLESAFAGLASRAESFATTMSAQMKICPQCGEGTTSDKVFCPHCGAKLPEKTLGQEYTCSKCGAANTPGTKYCAKCGAILPAAEAEAKAQQEADEAVLAKFDTLLPQYPRWDVGGKEFQLEENGDSNGYPVYTFNLSGGQSVFDAYIAKLLQAGFKQYGDQYWKTVDGICRTVSTVDAVMDGSVNIGFYVSNYDKQSQPKTAEEPVSDLRGMAKGLFGKFLK